MISNLKDKLELSIDENKKLKQINEKIKKQNERLGFEIQSLKKKDEIYENEITKRQADLQVELNKINEEIVQCSNEVPEQIIANKNKKSCKTPTCNGLSNIDGVSPYHST